MNESSCDIHDVTKAASDLVAFGCTIGATQLYDSFLQLQFSSIVSSYVNEVIKAVDEGLISAHQGLQEIKDEYADLSSKIFFYSQNGINTLAGAMQIQSGISKTINKRGIGVIDAIPYVAHGANNIYEGVENIYRGPGSQSVGPIRKIYHQATGDTHTGNIAYYSADLGLSMFGALRLVRKNGSVELFNRDPVNYERAYKQMGTLALAFEMLMDAITIKTLSDEFSKQNYE
ncbi:DUF4225 domain-containing protein [Pseudomonas synxantha]|uniref:Uncharacterized protein n=1 Tax=Pseudomonas synxantha TaxID=47883 RepID=A0ACC6JUX6_9PSED|nr:DUF4225 domain-containing protein [Pseudomonas synxantha]MDR6610059.1 hypothetical protein [Pseudomonas synxantha]